MYVNSPCLTPFMKECIEKKYLFQVKLEQELLNFCVHTTKNSSNKALRAKKSEWCV